MAILALFLTVPAFAAATKARTASQSNGILTVAGIADLSTGNTADVSDAGDLFTKTRPKSIETSVATAEVITSACTVHSVILTGMNAGATLTLWDALTPGDVTANVKVEIEVGTAKSTQQVVFPGGIRFSTAVSQTLSTQGDIATILYDTDSTT